MNRQQTFGERATKGFAWNYFYKITEFGLMNLYTILVVRHFGPAISAPYAVFTALCTTIAMIAAFAVDGVLLRYIQRISVNEPSSSVEFTNIESTGLRAFLKTLFAFRILVVALVSLLVAAGFLFLPNLFPFLSVTLDSLKGFILYLIVFLFTQSVTAFCTLTLVGLFETKRVFIASLISRSLLMIGGLVFVLYDILSLDHAIVLYVASSLVNAIVLLLALRKEVDKHAPSEHGEGRLSLFSLLGKLWQMVSHPKQIKLFLATPLMLYGITTWGSDILSTVLGKQPDILMMRAILGESAQIGYYLSASIVLLVTEYIFLFGLGGTLVSIFSKLAHDDEKENDGIRFPRLARAREEIAGFQNVVLMPLCAYMMVFAPDVIRMVYGSKYDEAIPMIRVGLVALVITVGFFGGGMQTTSLVAIGKERLVFRNRLFWGITNVTANYFLIRIYGGMGAIIGTQFVNAFVCGTEAYFARKIIGGKIFSLLGTSRIFLIAGIAGFAGYFLVSIISPIGNPSVHALMGIGICGMVTSLLYIVLKVPEAKKLWKRLQLLLKQTNLSRFAHE